MDTNATKALNDLASDSINSIREYFQSGSDSATGKAVMALKVLSRINGNDANRIKLLALHYQIARQSGLKGDSLKPLLAELNPALAQAQIEAPEGKSNEEN